MVKKLMLLLLALLLLLPVIALGENAHVIDQCHLFTDKEIIQMNEMIDEIIRTYQMDVAVLTADDVPANRSSYSEEASQDYADLYYENHGYGMGNNASGILYLLDMSNRVSLVSTGGDMIDYISDDRLEQLLSAADDSLSVGAYGRATLALLRELKQILQHGIEEGHFRYDAVTGERISGIYNKLTRNELLIALAAGVIVALILSSTVKGRYNMKGKTYKYDLESLSDMELTQNQQQFLRETVHRTRISENNGTGGSRSGGGSGSAVHHSSSGGTHGGGGHHF